MSNSKGRFLTSVVFALISPAAATAGLAQTTAQPPAKGPAEKPGS